MDNTIKAIKDIRVEQQKINDRIRKLTQSRPAFGAEATLALRAGQTVRHWLGESLGVIRENGAEIDHPYPEADNPDSTEISPPADVE